MLVAWLITSAVLGIIWLAVACVGLFFLVEDEASKEEFKNFSAIMSLAFMVVLFHVIVISLVIPVFVLYGLWQALKLLFRHGQEEDA